MFYPAGAHYTRTLENVEDLPSLRSLLCSEYECIAGMLAQPFGNGRGQVLAQRGHMLVLTFGNGVTDVVVVPTREIQNLLWSVSNGYASQWSSQELRMLTGQDNWNQVLTSASVQLNALADDVRRAIAGKRKPVAERVNSFDGELMELPSDYLQSVPMGDQSCAP